MNFLDSVSKNTVNFMKIRPVGSHMFHVDRRTDMTKLIVAFRSFANAHKNDLIDCLKFIAQVRRILRGWF